MGFALSNNGITAIARIRTEESTESYQKQGKTQSQLVHSAQLLLVAAMRGIGSSNNARHHLSQHREVQPFKVWNWVAVGQPWAYPRPWPSNSRPGGSNNLYVDVGKMSILVARVPYAVDRVLARSML